MQASYSPKPDPFKCTEKYNAGTEEKPRMVKCQNKAKDMTDEIDISSIVSALYNLGDYINNDVKNKVSALSSTFSLIDSDVIYVEGETISKLAANCAEDLNTIVDNAYNSIDGIQGGAISTFEALQTAENEIAKNNCHFS